MNDRADRPDAERIVLDATRALLRIGDAAEVRDIAVDMVHEMGGEVARADADVHGAIPLDISFGAGPALLPFAEPASVGRMLIERFLPAFVEDGRRAIALLHTADRLAEEASVDPLTGLSNRRATGRVLGRLGDSDVVALLDLDRFKALNDTLGHEEGDRVLKRFGSVLRSQLRQSDHAGRHGGEEFLLVFSDTTLDDAHDAVGRLAEAWKERRPHPVTFSAGIAEVRSGSDPVAAADRALYRAKDCGRDNAQTADEEDYQ